MTQKSPLPLLAALLAGGALMFYGTKKRQNPVEPEDEVPTSIDYDDENLKDALRQTAEDSEPEAEEDE